MFPQKQTDKTLHLTKNTAVMGRYFLIFVGVVSLFWIGYLSVDIIDKGNDYSPFQTFGREDGRILIINRNNEVERAALPFQTSLKNDEVLGAILPNISTNSTIFISSLRDHFLIEAKSNWSQSNIKKLLAKSKLTLHKSVIGFVEIDGYKIKYHRNRLYFYKKSYKTNYINDWNHLDRKASAVIVDFSQGNTIVKDIYFKGSNKIEFHSTNIQNIEGNKINDKELFSQVLPKRIKEYHFLEKKYLESTDNTFQKSTMNSWTEKGLVFFQYKAKRVLVSDYKIGQNPVNILADESGEPSENQEHGFFKGIRLTKDFPSNPQNGFYVYILNDFVVIAEESQICEEVITQIKLGQTLATDQLTLHRIFNQLPSRVSERYIALDEQYTKSVYRSKIFETRLSIKQNEELENDLSSDLETITMNVDAVIQDFISFDEKGNAAVLTATGELIYFSNGKISWIKNLQSKGLGTISYVESFQYLLITCKNSIHLLDRKGNYIVGGPISLESNKPVSAAVSFEWKHKLYFVYPDEKGQLVVVNSKRKIVSSFVHGLVNPNSSVDVWISQNRLFFGLRNVNTFKMFDAEKKTQYRSFSIPAFSQSIPKKHDALIFSNDRGQFVVFDQKGGKQQLGSISGNIMRTPWGRNEIFLLNENDGKISVFDSFGSTVTKITSESSDIEKIDAQTIQNKTFITVIDGLENNVYIYDIFGRKLLNHPLEGSEKCLLNWSNGQLILTTVVDKYLIQYTIAKN